MWSFHRPFTGDPYRVSTNKRNGAYVSGAISFVRCGCYNFHKCDIFGILTKSLWKHL